MAGNETVGVWSRLSGELSELVTRIFSGSSDTAFPGLFAGKRFPDRLVIQAVDGHGLRGRRE